MNLRSLVIACVPAVAVLTASRPSPAWESSRAQLEEYHRLSLRLETPHTKWARPYARGTTRVLYFVSSDNEGMETHARHVVELMQRFDVEVTPVYRYKYYGLHWLGGNMAGNRRVHHLMTQKEYDVYVFQGVSPEKLPTWPRDGSKDALARAVAAGAGIVLIGADDGGTVPGRQDLDELPSFLAGAGVSGAFTAGDGRGVTFPGTPTIPYRVGWETKYDYWQEGLGRAVLWAAGRAPEMRIELTAPGTVRRAGLPADCVAVAWKNPPPGDVRWRAALRRWDGERTALGEGRVGDEVRLPRERRRRHRRLPVGEGRVGDEVRLRLPVLRAGGYHVDVIARSDRGVEAWATVPVEVTAGAAVQAIDLKTDWAEVGDALAGRVNVAGLVGGRTLRVRLMDRRGRVLAQQDLEPQEAGEGETAAPFEFPVRHWMPMLVRVEAVVLEDGREVASDYRFFNVTKRHRDRFNFVLWDFSVDQTLAPYMADSMQRHGVTVIVSTRRSVLSAAAYELAWAPFTGGNVNAARHLTGRPTEDKAAWSVGRFRESRGHGAYLYSMGDEGDVAGSGTDPAAMEFYREYLQKVYGDIAALNDSWGTDFTGFAGVILSEAKDNHEAAALKAGNYPRWYDRQAFQRYNFVEYCKVHRDAMLKVDPEAIIGFEGSGRFARSGDIDLFCRELDFWVPYASSVDEMIRSIASRDFVRGNWMGYHHSADGLLSKYWRMIGNGANSVWWWMWTGLGAWHGFIAPDLGVLPATEEMLKDTQVVRDGLGDLLMHCEMLHDGIALLYSMPSSFAVTLEDGPSYNDYEPNHRAWHTVVHDMPLQFRYVSDRTLTRGEFDPDEFKMLVLAQAVAMSDKEADLVRDFVLRGGTVVADLRPGVFDGRCKPRDRGALDDLFGVAGPVRRKAVRTAMHVELPGKDKEKPLKLDWPDAIVDPGTQLDGGRALGAAGGPPAGGETPVWIVREHGEGRAVLLNFAMSQFPARRVARGLTHQASYGETPPAVWRAFRRLLGRAGVDPTMRLTRYKGPWDVSLRNVKLQRWRNGEMQIVSVFRETGPAVTAHFIIAPRSRWVYDLREDMALGKIDSGWAKGDFVMNVVPSRATFYALLPRELPRPVLDLAAPRVAAGLPAVLRLSVPEAVGLHALKLTAVRPDGEPADYWEQVVIVGREPKEVALPVAHNDPAGVYTLTVRDVFDRKTPHTTALTVLTPELLAE